MISLYGQFDEGPGKPAPKQVYPKMVPLDTFLKVYPHLEILSAASVFSSALMQVGEFNPSHAETEIYWKGHLRSCATKPKDLDKWKYLAKHDVFLDTNLSFIQQDIGEAYMSIHFAGGEIIHLACHRDPRREFKMAVDALCLSNDKGMPVILVWCTCVIQTPGGRIARMDLRLFASAEIAPSSSVRASRLWREEGHEL